MGTILTKTYDLGKQMRRLCYAHKEWPLEGNVRKGLGHSEEIDLLEEVTRLIREGTNMAERKRIRQAANLDCDEVKGAALKSDLVILLILVLAKPDDLLGGGDAELAEPEAPAKKQCSFCSKDAMDGRKTCRKCKTPSKRPKSEAEAPRQRSRSR